MAEYYTQRSSAGLLITEGTTISEEANGWNESPGIYTDEMTEGWKHTTNAVHEKGAVIFFQLWHTGRASHSSFHGGKPAVAPSAIKINEPDIHTSTGKQPLEVPRALETSEVPRVVEDYRRAAGNCGYTQQTAAEAIAAGNADLISFGRPFISNPDLAERFRHGWPLSEPAPISDWYSPTGGKGYTDFPAHAPPSAPS
jgi:2,4-dienoyl-CoA reductase-like NADH-dependent reductase (Old Yellow Enzyme family)